MFLCGVMYTLNADLLKALKVSAACYDSVRLGIVKVAATKLIVVMFRFQHLLMFHSSVYCFSSKLWTVAKKAVSGV